MKIWLRRGPQEGFWMYLDDGKTCYLVKIFRNKLILRKFIGPSDYLITSKKLATDETLNAISLEMLLKRIRKEQVLADPFAFTMLHREQQFPECTLCNIKDLRPKQKKEKVK